MPTEEPPTPRLAPPTGEMKRANFIGVPAMFNLQAACAMVVDAFGWCVFLVGSSLERRDYRDVDVRAILDDVEYDRLFPRHAQPQCLDPLWNLMCVSISEWLASRTGLPIDFQIQRHTDANAEYHGQRSALGVFVRNSTRGED